MINVIVLASVFILSLLAYYKGSRILLTAIISFYPASMLYTSLPIKTKLLFLGTVGEQLFYSHALIFGILFLLIFLPVYRITGHESLGYGTAKWINAFLVGGSFVLALLALSFHILPTNNIFQIETGSIRTFWSSDWGYFTGIVAPLIAIWRIATTSRSRGLMKTKDWS
jgi:hypothetical protein